MKRIVTVLLLLCFATIAKSQLSGNGTYTSPWNGTLAGDATWSGTRYINGDITVDNEKLTISEGAVIIFLSETAELIITGTGQLEANGSPSSKITLTADDDNDGTYGETGERWGHISFESMGSAGASVINNCIIEYGDVSSTSLSPVNPKQYGGAIHADFSNLTISSCEIRHNKAGWGGGIFVGDGRNPTISNCYIHENTATTSGGGMYFWKNSYSVFSNSIVTYNSCTGTGGGGGIFIGGTAKNVSVVNCLISHNSGNSESLGHNIKIYNNSNTPKPQFINSIIWYPANSIVGSLYTTDFYYCAIQDPPLTYTGCIALNSANEATGPDGPFFSSMSGDSWTLQFRSPCRDAGTTTSPAVANDYVGNPRVWNYDIGAYEYQYSRWTGSTSTSWSTSSNWEENVDPSSGTGDVVIPSGLSTYPVNTSNPDFTIGSDKVMILEPGTRATLDDLTNNGTLRMEANSSGLSSLIMNSYSKGGGATDDIQLYLTGGYIGDPEYNEGRWHYISTPVANFSKNIFTANTNDLAQWVDGMQSAGSLRDGWVAHDGYIYYTSTSDPSTWTGPTFNTLTLGKGYNFWDNLSSYTYSISGQLNTGSVNANLSFAGEEYENGFNLLGNPFTSGLDWDYIVENTSFPDYTSHGIYFTKENVQYSYVSGVLVPNDGIPAPSGVIPPMQGFFVKTYSTGNTINLTSAARTHDDIPERYKGTSSIPLVRLEFSDNGARDETVVRFAEKALTGIDMAYDALKMYNPGKSSIFTNIPGNKMSINGQPFPEPETYIEIPVSVNVLASGNHTISAKEIQEISDYDVYLIDNSTGYTGDLKTNPELTFTSSTGLIEGRFILKISNISTGIEDPSTTNKPFSVYQWSDYINIQTLSDTWDGKTGTIKIYDLTGRLFNEIPDNEYYKNSIIRTPSPEQKGLYIVEITAGRLRHVGKVMIN